MGRRVDRTNDGATAWKGEIMRYTEYHAGKAVIKDRKLLPGAMEKLAAYENTGLTPEQIMDLKERDTAKPPIDIEDNYGFFVCPSCGNSIYASDDFESHKFCLNCGQRIQWRE